MKIRAACVTLLTFAVVLFLAANAEALKAEMPKEGTLEWDYCGADPVIMPVATKDLMLCVLSVSLRKELATGDTGPSLQPAEEEFSLPSRRWRQVVHPLPRKL